jgi:hypothetical protein
MAEAVRQVIRIYKNKDLNAYHIELVDCDEKMIYDDERLRPNGTIYYLCPRIASGKDVYDLLREELFNYRIKKTDHYVFNNFNRQFYQAITCNQWISAAECVLLNHVCDDQDTLKKQFIKRLRKYNITEDNYKPNNTLKYPVDPECIFVDFDWDQV